MFSSPKHALEALASVGYITDAITATVVHLAARLPADTEIYVILQKGAKETVQSSRSQSLPQAASQPNIEELRQLMQLQRELNQPAGNKSAPE